MVTRNEKVINRAIELFGQLMGQELAKNPITPKDTGLMRSTFANTVQVLDGPKGKIIRFTTPNYTKYVNEGTPAIRTRHFIQRVFHQKGEEILKKSFRIASNQIK